MSDVVGEGSAFERAEISQKNAQRSDDATHEPVQKTIDPLGESNSDEIDHRADNPPAISKNQQKKLKRKQEWEAGREARKAHRKEKLKLKKERHRAARSERDIHAEKPEEAEFQENVDAQTRIRSRPHVKVPVTLLLDCQFDDLMTEPEVTSLGNQLTRSYSDNRKAAFQAHLAVSSFGGKLKERYDGILSKAHESWHGVKFFEDDFVAVSEKASAWMKGAKGGEIVGALKRLESSVDESSVTAGASPGGSEIVYLTSDSPDTLTTLKPYSTYIVGGLVDKNRHKGVCFKRAMDRNIKTAKLPIGEYMHMRSRTVLTTNQVVEIMLKWLEVGDWSDAFSHVIPQRKGATLKDSSSKQPGGEIDQEADFTNTT